MKKNTRLKILCILCVCIFFVALGASHITSVKQTESLESTQSIRGVESSVSQKVLKVLTADGSTYGYKVLLSETPELRTKGLSGRQSLGTDEVMLFMFEREGRNFFWMKDMLFPIDIVWVGADRRIIHIEKNVSPESFPKSFGPDENSKYVLEFKAGTADSVGIKIGDSVSF